MPRPKKTGYNRHGRPQIGSHLRKHPYVKDWNDPLGDRMYFVPRGKFKTKEEAMQSSKLWQQLGSHTRILKTKQWWLLYAE